MKDMKVGLTWNQDYKWFSNYFPKLETIETTKILEIIRSYDLIIFPGGEDISPEYYGQADTYARFCNPNRDEFELKIFRYCKKYLIPTLGICRGHQLINVVEGGRLEQDLFFGGFTPHSYSHELEWSNTNNFIYKIIGENEVCSTHHQGISEVGIFGTSLAKKDGIIEAVTFDKYPIITFQFHPEYYQEENWTKDLFEEIANWAKKAKEVPPILKQKRDSKFDNILLCEDLEDFIEFCDQMAGEI